MSICMFKITSEYQSKFHKLKFSHLFYPLYAVAITILRLWWQKKRKKYTSLLTWTIVQYVYIFRISHQHFSTTVKYPFRYLFYSLAAYSVQHLYGENVFSFKQLPYMTWVSVLDFSTNSFEMTASKQLLAHSLDVFFYLWMFDVAGFLLICLNFVL